MVEMFLFLNFTLFLDNWNLSRMLLVVVEVKIFLVNSVVTLCCRMDILLLHQQMTTDEMILTYYTWLKVITIE